MSKPRLIDSDYCRAANTLGCEPAMIAAVAEQESLGAGFDTQDRPTILFERHIFHRLTGGKYDKSNPNISNPNPGGYGSSASQYIRFSAAFALNPDAAMKATSWGKFQILGQNYKVCGFANVGDFVTAMKESEAKQLDAFCAFVLGNGLDDALTNRDATAFANGYNGHGYRKNHYDTKISAGYKRWSKHDFNCSQVAENPSTVEDPAGSISSPPSEPASNPVESPGPGADASQPDGDAAASGSGDPPPADPSPNDTPTSTQVNIMQPYEGLGFWSVIKGDIAKLTGGNITLQTLSAYRDQIQDLGIPSKILLVLAGAGLVASAVYLLFRLVHYLVWVFKEHQRIAAELAVNKDPKTPNLQWTNIKPGDVPAAEIPAVEAGK